MRLKRTVTAAILLTALVLSGCSGQDKPVDVLNVVTATPAPTAKVEDVSAEDSTDSQFVPIVVQDAPEYYRIDNEVLPIPISVVWEDEDFTKTFDDKTIMNASFMVPYLSTGLTVTDGYYSNIAAAIASFRGILTEKAVEALEIGYNYATDAMSMGAVIAEPYYDFTRTMVNRADSSVVSFLTYNENYFGGTHMHYEYCGYNYDTATGRQLSLNEVLSDKAKKDDYSKLIKIVKEQVEDSFVKWNYNAPDDFCNYSVLPNLFAQDSIPFTIDYQGITLYINTYVIGPYAAGSFTIHIPFNKYADLLTDTYKKVPCAYMIDSLVGEFAYDLNNDGVYENFVCPGSEEAGSIGYSCLIHNTDGSNFIYSLKQGDNDYRYIEIYSAKTDEIALIGKESREIMSVADVNPWSCHNIVDPQEFLFETRTDVLGTTFEKIACHIDENGFPQRHSRYHSFVGELPELTLKKDMTFQLIDSESDEPVENVDLPTGTILVLFRTDCLGVVDFKAENERIYRIRTENIDPDEYFEGIGNAG